MNTMKGHSMSADDLVAVHCSTCLLLAKHGCRRMMAAHLLECHKVYDNYNVECLCGEVIYVGMDEPERLFAHFVDHECQEKRMNRLHHDFWCGVKCDCA